MDDRLVSLMAMIEATMRAPVCRACLADLLSNALGMVLRDFGPDSASATQAAVETITERPAVAH